MEVDSLSYRITNIHQAYFNTSHVGLRDRLFYENKDISKRLNEILSIAKALKNRTNENISFSSLLIAPIGTQTVSVAPSFIEASPL